MSETGVVMNPQGGAITTKEFFARESVQKKFEEMLGKKAQGFVVSVLQIVNSNELLKKADPMSIYNSACLAATLDLPINANLGYAYIVPYAGKAQFQMGWKGFVQLAQRSGLFKTMNSVEVCENQIEKVDYLTGEITLKNEEPKGKVTGFVAYFKLLNGFEKHLYMSREKMEIHAKKYSQTYKKGFGVWAEGEDGFISMGKKTVLKLLLSKFAPLSIEMQRAVITDQAIINNEHGTDITYADTEVVDIDKEEERIQLLLSDCKTVAEVKILQEANPNVDVVLIDKRVLELAKPKKS